MEDQTIRIFNKENGTFTRLSIIEFQEMNASTTLYASNHICIRIVCKEKIEVKYTATFKNKSHWSLETINRKKAIVHNTAYETKKSNAINKNYEYMYRILDNIMYNSF